jgi:hypothetical protein
VLSLGGNNIGLSFGYGGTVLQVSALDTGTYTLVYDYTRLI